VQSDAEWRADQSSITASASSTGESDDAVNLLAAIFDKLSPTAYAQDSSTYGGNDFPNEGTGALWTTKYTYTTFDAISTRQDARGVVTTYGYDTLNRLTSISYNTSSAPGVASTGNVTYTYDTPTSRVRQKDCCFQSALVGVGAIKKAMGMIR
jgi:YD repeat-containing protein